MAPDAHLVHSPRAALSSAQLEVMATVESDDNALRNFRIASRQSRTVESLLRRGLLCAVQNDRGIVVAFHLTWDGHVALAAAAR